uniref:Uncharacterized protein n=1 Tax=Lygus hesperus TaxID=30085 RepID=A0A0A9ZDB4_LYGHE
MQGLFNKQQCFIKSLFSKGVFAKQNDIITVCYRKVVTTSRSALHHGKGVTYKLQGGRGSDCGPNVRSPRPCSSKFHKKSCWLKKPKSRKSCGSSCTITKSRKGKIIFRVTRQSLPKVILEEHTEKPSSTFKNSINKVFESKLVLTRKSKIGLNDAKSQVDKLSLPDFKDTSIVSTSHRKTFKNSFVKVMQKSRSAESQIVTKQNQSVVKSVPKSVNISNPEKIKRVDSYSKQVRVEEKTILSCKSNKNAPNISFTSKKPRKGRPKPLNFSSSEMLYSNADKPIKLGFDKIKKCDSSLKKCEEQRKPVVDGVKEVNQGDGVAQLLEGNSCIQPLEENIDSNMKLFMGRTNKGVSRKNGPSFSDIVKNVLKIENDETALDLACSGESKDLRASQLDTSMRNYAPRGADIKTEFGKVENHHGDAGKSDGVNQSTLFSKIPSGDITDTLNEAPLKSSQITTKAEKVNNSTTHNVQTLKRGDNITLHRHVDLKRPIRQERVEFDTTVIEQNGKKITKIKPKHDSNLRKKDSNRSLIINKDKMHDNRSSDKGKSVRSTKVESFVLAKTKDRADDVLVIPEDGKKITLSEIDPFIPKINLQILNREHVVIPGDGRKITGESDSSVRGVSNRQHGDYGKQGLKSEGIVVPQGGNKNRRLETKTESFILRSESWPSKNDGSGKSSGNAVGSQNEMRLHQSEDDRMYGRHNPKKTEDVGLKDSQNQIQSKEVSHYKPIDFKHRDNPIFDSSFGINQHVFVQNNLKSKGAMISEHHSSMKDAIQQKNEPELAKNSPESVSSETSKQVLESLTQQMSANRISHTEEMKELRTVPDQQRALEQVTQTNAERSALNQNASTAVGTKKSWRNLLPFYSSKSTNVPEKKMDDRQPPFSNSFTAVSKSPGSSDPKVGELQWSRKVTKIKFSPSQSEPTQPSGYAMSALPGQGTQPSAEPKIAATSDTATSVVVKSRFAQNPSEPARSLPQTQVYSSITSTSSTTHAVVKAPNGISIPANVKTSGFQLGSLAKERAETVCPSSSSSLALGTQATGHLSMTNKTESSSVNSGISNSNSGYPSNMSSNMPKASFPPPCNACQSSPLMLTGSQGSCSTDGCNQKSVFPPPCNPCESPSRHQPEQPDCFNCPTCKPEFPPPCPPNNPCSTPKRAENSCYDPCNPVTKSKTHTILDISNLPRPPTPICIDCVPKTKPCFPPECAQQCKNTPSTCCHQTNKTKGREVSFANWRAFVNYTYWSMKCLLTGVFANFLTALKTRILHMSELKKKSICPKPINPQSCGVMQSSVIRPRKASYRVASRSMKSHKIVNSKLQQVRPTTTNKVRKKTYIVKSMKKSVLDDTKRAILAEEEKRKSVGAKAPALAYSEVLNIVFSQKK